MDYFSDLILMLQQRHEVGRYGSKVDLCNCSTCETVGQALVSELKRSSNANCSGGTTRTLSLC
jgi:hypothetical protein